jgi:hypothetical protein
MRPDNFEMLVLGVRVRDSAYQNARAPTKNQAV